MHVIPWVATKWYDLGLELLETKYIRELDIIKANYRTDVKECCRQLFIKWLETRPDASWAQLIQAVKSIELHNAVCYIEQFIRGEYDRDTDVSTISTIPYINGVCMCIYNLIQKHLRCKKGAAK